MGPTDEELMSAYVAGDARAFEKLFARLAPRVHAFFRRSFRDEGVADDLLQVTFMKVHRARAQYRPDLKLGPWLFAVAARGRVDAPRRRFPLPEGDLDRETFFAHARGCSGCMEALREGEKLVAALASAELPPPSRRALRRASAPILAELTPSRWPLRAAAAVAAFAIPILFSHHRDLEGWAAALLVLTLATALSATAGTLHAGAWVAHAASPGPALGAGGLPGFAAPGPGLPIPAGVACPARGLALARHGTARSVRLR